MFEVVEGTEPEGIRHFEVEVSASVVKVMHLGEASPTYPSRYACNFGLETIDGEKEETIFFSLYKGEMGPAVSFTSIFSSFGTNIQMSRGRDPLLSELLCISLP
jgi:hypothetical protein